MREIIQLTSENYILNDLDEEKILLWASGSILEQLLNLVGLLSTANDTEIAMALLSNGNFHFEYSELRKELMAISKPREIVKKGRSKD